MSPNDDTSSGPFEALRWSALRQRITTYVAQSPMAEDMLPLMMAVVVGLATGLGAYIFIVLLEQIGELTHLLNTRLGAVGTLSIMAASGLIVGLIISTFASEAKGHGVPEVMEAIALKRGRIRPRVAVAKVIASALTIGTGGSAGREGPIVQVGSALGSTAGQVMRLSDEQVGMLVASGAAAGIAAAFNAPIAGTMFAVEVILGRLSNRYLGIVMISAVAANVVSRALIGEHAAFQIPSYGLQSARELVMYVLLAILAALAAIVFIRVLYGAEHFFDRWQVPLAVKTTVGMLLTGVIGLSAPQVLGSGLAFIGETVAQDMSLTVPAMLAFFVLKLLATTMTLGTGNSGGVFAPALFMGAMIGGIVGQFSALVFPQLAITPGAYALVGMAAMFAGAARAPIASIIIVLEMSNDYRLILPLLMTVILSTLIADFLHPDSIYTRKLTLRGIRLQRGQDIDLLQSVTAEEVMDREYTTIRPDETLGDLMPRFRLTHHHGFPIVGENGHLVGMVTLTDIERASAEHIDPQTPITQIGTTSNLITVAPDDPIYVALRRLNIHGIGRLPVVSRSEPNKYLGMVRRSNILRAYELALVRRSTAQRRLEQLKLRNVDGTSFIEVEVTPDAPMVNHQLRSFPHSQDCLLVSVRRKGKTLIAHGDTVIKPGDHITVFAENDKHHLVKEQFCTSYSRKKQGTVELPTSDETGRRTLKDVEQYR